jgi:uncharacterized protein YcbK (DUF882 family)
MKKFLLAILVLFFFASFYLWPSREILLQWKYDLFNNNPYVNEANQIQEILNSYPSVSIQDVDSNYLKQTQQNVEPFKSMLKNAVFKRIPNSEIHRKIVGNFRVKDFLPKDDYFKQALYLKNDSLYWLIDEKLLYLVLAFQDELSAQGHNRDAFVITNGYRHPKFNVQVGGASESRHIVGEAVDITAKDINDDGKVNQEDKTIILAAAEKVVGNLGGVGMYPNTLSIHMDTRGHKARWNSF